MNNTFILTDPQRAAFFIAKGVRFLNAEQHIDGKRLQFVFDNSNGLADEMAASFVRNDAVGIADYLFALKNLRELIWSSKVSGGIR